MSLAIRMFFDVVVVVMYGDRGGDGKGEAGRGGGGSDGTVLRHRTRKDTDRNEDAGVNFQF